MINTTVLKKQDYAKWSIFNANLEVEAFIESLIWRKIVSAQSFEDSKNLPGFVSNSFLHGVKWGQSGAFFGKNQEKKVKYKNLYYGQLLCSKVTIFSEVIGLSNIYNDRWVLKAIFEVYGWCKISKLGKIRKNPKIWCFLAFWWNICSLYVIVK